MSKQNTAVLALAGAGVLGAGIYTMKYRKDPPQQSKNKTQDKKDMGLGGAGVGLTGAAGGNERAIHPGKDHEEHTTAPKEKLPSGGVGGGAGAGGTGSRAVEFGQKSGPGSFGGSESNNSKSI
jgi:hypothetical protein